MGDTAVAAGSISQHALWLQEVARHWRGTIFELPDFLARISHRSLRIEAVLSRFPGSDESKRARCLREAMGFSGRGGQQAFAEFLGVERSTWNNVECGAPLGKEMALRIVRKFPGVTLDWLFLGRPEGLTVEMARMLSGPSKGNDADGDSPSSLASYR
jgi:plasmid maintenance system antidote protein VapI